MADRGGGGDMPIAPDPGGAPTMAQQAAQAPQATQAPQAAPNPVVQAVVGSYTPAILGAAGQIQGLQTQAGNLANIFGAQQATAQQSAGLQAAQLGLQGQQIGLQQQAVGNPLDFLSYYNTMTGITPSNLTDPSQIQAYLSALGGANFNPSNQQQMLGLQQAISQQQYGLQKGQFGIEKQQMLGQEAAQGSTQTVGAHQQMQQLGMSEAQAALQNIQTQAGYSLSEQDMQRQGQALNLTAQANGISEQQVVNGIQNTLNQIGLQGIMSVGDILNQINGIKTGTVSTVAQGTLQILAPYLLQNGINISQAVGNATQGLGG